jgi:TonB family protein
MYFDFEDYRPDTPRVVSAISWRGRVLLSLIFHVLVVVALVASPRLFPVDREAARARAEEFARRLAEAREQTRFVFVQPLVDRIAPRPPERADASDENRVARAPERAREPANELPFARGNTPERVQELPAPPPAGGPEPEAEAAPAPEPETPAAEPIPERESELAYQTPAPPPPSPPVAAAGASRRAPAGSLGDALRNLQRYVEMFDNQQGGGGQFGPEIQFDTKGVEFGPWIRRFVAQVKRNWFVPYSAMSMRGHVVIQFNVHKSGTITDVNVVGPCPIEAFNNAAYGAILGSNPTQPLPAAYPAEQAFFTVTFFYNETPQ